MNAQTLERKRTARKLHLDRAIEALGGLEAMAIAINAKSGGAVKQWRMERVPAEFCPAIERETRALAVAQNDPRLTVICEQLRPDVAWGALRAHDAVMAKASEA